MPAIVASARTASLDIGQVEVGPFFTFELDEPVLELIGQLRNLRSALAQRSVTAVECSAVFRESAPELVLRPPAVAELAALGAALTVTLDYRPDVGTQPTAVTLGDLPQTSDPRVEVMFRIHGVGFDPDAVTRIVGLTPTTTWRVGKQVGRSRIRSRVDSWDLTAAPSRDFASQLDQLLAVIDPRADAIREAAAKVGAQASIEVDWRYTPGKTRLSLRPDHIAAAQRLGALIWFDTIPG